MKKHSRKKRVLAPAPWPLQRYTQGYLRSYHRRHSKGCSYRRMLAGLCRRYAGSGWGKCALCFKATPKLIGVGICLTCHKPPQVRAGHSLVIVHRIG